ncbi:hypothetical protein [Pantoea allii]|uniref:hypothetical protein n=1 Tax=Pantoea allii TaxID=574096 RepID=UPI0024B8068D|nr:hypothetical protein [Pantoea allii]MDJ0091188.1 hypothetical protein [Pantoea allii]
MLKSSYYYVCPYTRGGWIIHKEGCIHLDNGRGREFIGSLYTRQQALTVAKIHHPDVILCTACLSPYVCPQCWQKPGSTQSGHAHASYAKVVLNGVCCASAERAFHLVGTRCRKGVKNRVMKAGRSLPR